MTEKVVNRGDSGQVVTTHPEALLEKIAQAILDNFHGPDDTHSTWWIDPRASSRAVLDLFEVREDVQTVDTERHSDGRIEGHAIDIHRYVLTTPWEDAS